MTRKPLLVLGLACSATALSGPAHGQIWLGQLAADMAQNGKNGQCLNGKGETINEEKRLGIQADASAKVQQFWNTALSGRANTQTELPLGGKWLNKETSEKRTSAAFLADPLSPRPEWRLEPQPTSFLRAGAIPTRAYGYWKVVDATDPGRGVAYYRVDLSRVMLQWGISTIEPVPAGEIPEAKPFCSDPGDIERFEQYRAEKAAKRAAKQAAKAGER